VDARVQARSRSRPRGAAVRETFEETRITLDPSVLRHALSIHQRNQGTADTRIGFAFAPSVCDGEPVKAEPHKHSELVSADPAALPPDTAEYTAAVITAAEHGLTFTLNGW
jgi:8-oxo-dGTP pyrophosphatase MutT (NUDIX family)